MMALFSKYSFMVNFTCVANGKDTTVLVKDPPVVAFMKSGSVHCSLHCTAKKAEKC